MPSDDTSRESSRKAPREQREAAREPGREPGREAGRGTAREASSAPAGRRPPKEEPDFVNEADIPTEDAPPDRGARAPAGRQSAGRARAAPRAAGPNPDVHTPPNADVAGTESAAGEEDPGAALDSPPNPRSPA